MAAFVGGLPAAPPLTAASSSLRTNQRRHVFALKAATEQIALSESWRFFPIVASVAGSVARATDGVVDQSLGHRRTKCKLIQFSRVSGAFW